MKKTIAAIACVLGLGWLYLPPFGTRVNLKDLEPFLAPDVPHSDPTFINTGRFVYYRVRLGQPVSWDYSQRYLRLLRERGVQIQATGDAPDRLLQMRRGFKINMVREEALQPYTIRYWRSVDDKSGFFPASVRWPWLYFRLGPSVLESKTLVLVPETDAVPVRAPIPRYPGARVVFTAAWPIGAISLWLVANATEEQVLAYYAGLGLGKVVSSQGYVVIDFAAGCCHELGDPDSLEAKIEGSLTGLLPVQVYPRQKILSPDTNPVQPTLPNLPDVTPYRLDLIYQKNAKRATQLHQAWTSLGVPQ